MKNSEREAFACTSDQIYQPGLTKREYFTAMAMQALASNPNYQKSILTKQEWERYRDWIASASVDLADTVLDEIELPKVP